MAGSLSPLQAPLLVLKDKECPAMLIPSTPCTSVISEELVNDLGGVFGGSGGPAGVWGSRFPS